MSIFLAANMPVIDIFAADLREDDIIVGSRYVEGQGYVHPTTVANGCPGFRAVDVTPETGVFGRREVRAGLAALEGDGHVGLIATYPEDTILTVAGDEER